MKANETAEIVRAVEKYYVERGTDLFIVKYRGTEMTVQRQDIVKAGS